ncbi:MAG: DNA-binding protein [Bacteroides sp.]|nr:DNA-binding protein [Bacteroides sp.]
MILYKKHFRTVKFGDGTTAKKVYPYITYKYSNPAKLKEVAQQVSKTSGVSEGTVYSVLKDFRSQLKEELLAGRIVNIEGLGYFYLSIKGNGCDTLEEFTSNNITGLRICFQANSDIRLTASGTTRTDGLTFKDVDKIDGEEESGDGSDTDTDNTTDSGNGGSSSGGSTDEEYPIE